jgi:hypothetical protein
MKRIFVPLFVLIIIYAIALAAGAPNFAGEYADKGFPGGQAVFQMSLEQNGNFVKVWFSTGYNDGHGAAPEAGGTEK